MSDVLVIGTQGISHRDDMVLRALVRLLDGGINIRARFSEQLEESATSSLCQLTGLIASPLPASRWA